MEKRKTNLIRTKMPFNKHKDSIAITIPHFEMKKSADIFGGVSEPYIISISIDESGLSGAASNIHFNTFAFPNVKRLQQVKFGGVGRMIYGPQNPGKFVSYSILFMESDSDVRQAGEYLAEIFASPAAKVVTNALAIANPTYAVAAKVVAELGTLVGKMMKKNKDDELFRIEGTLLQDTNPPYYIGDTFESFNKYIACPVNVIPLIEDESNDRGIDNERLLVYGNVPQTMIIKH